MVEYGIFTVRHGTVRDFNISPFSYRRTAYGRVRRAVRYSTGFRIYSKKMANVPKNRDVDRFIQAYGVPLTRRTAYGTL